MSCLSGAVTRVGDFSVSLALVSGVSAAIDNGCGADISLVPESGLNADLEGKNGSLADLSRKGGSAVGLYAVGVSAFSLEGGTSVAMDIERKGYAVASLFREGQFDGAFSWVTDISAGLEQVCSVNVTVPYLEIEPEIVWVVDGWAANDVISNTHWNVD